MPQEQADDLTCWITRQEIAAAPATQELLDSATELLARVRALVDALGIEVETDDPDHKRTADAA